MLGDDQRPAALTWAVRLLFLLHFYNDKSEETRKDMDELIRMIGEDPHHKKAEEIVRRVENRIHKKLQKNPFSYLDFP